MKGIIKLQRQRVAVVNGLAESWSLEAASQGKRVCAAGGTSRSAGQPGPWAGSFLPLSCTKERRGFTRSEASQKVLYMPGTKNTIAFVKTETFHKSLLTETGSIAGEKCKGKRSTHKWHYFLSTLYSWCWCYQTEWYREKLVYFPLASFPSQPFFCSQVSRFSLLLLFLVQQRIEKHLKSCNIVNL